nr:MAG TPA: hypothetical protein [Caudoviricetes sp.]DAS83187.1 MAG TPA: hypothetical protein [Caudoviricetes sp.]
MKKNKKSRTFFFIIWNILCKSEYSRPSKLNLLLNTYRSNN